MVFNMKEDRLDDGGMSFEQEGKRNEWHNMTYPFESESDSPIRRMCSDDNCLFLHLHSARVLFVLLRTLCDAASHSYGGNCLAEDQETHSF